MSNQLAQLQRFYEGQGDRAGVGRSLWKLADVEQQLGNFEASFAYAREAEAYAADMPVPLKMNFHSDLGFYLLNGGEIEAGMDHFLVAYDYALAAGEQQRVVQAQPIAIFFPIYASELDASKYRTKALLMLAGSPDPTTRELFQQVLDVLADGG